MDLLDFLAPRRFSSSLLLDLERSLDPESDLERLSRDMERLSRDLERLSLDLERLPLDLDRDLDLERDLERDLELSLTSFSRRPSTS